MLPFRDLTVQTDGALSFTIRNGTERPWWWYLDLNETPLYLIGNACGTCEAIFRRVQDLNVPIAPNALSSQLSQGLESIPDTVIQTMQPLLPKGEYIVAVLNLYPARTTARERPQGVGCEADYFWWRLFRQYEDGIDYELTLPSVPEAKLHAPRIAWYRSQIQQGYKPTALALSMVDSRAAGAGQYLEWALVHFLLDGHHKVMAASQLGQPITLLSFLRETALTGIPSIDKTARAYYAASGKT